MPMSNRTWTVEETDAGVLVRDRTRQYAFVRLSLSDVQGTAFEGRDDCVVFVGDSTSVWYINGKALDSVPEPYLQAVADRGYTILDGVDGGWQSWEGRPEWSDPYLDLSDATEYDPDSDPETDAEGDDA